MKSWDEHEAVFMFTAGDYYPLNKSVADEALGGAGAEHEVRRSRGATAGEVRDEISAETNQGQGFINLICPLTCANSGFYTHSGRIVLQGGPVSDTPIVQPCRSQHAVQHVLTNELAAQSIRSRAFHFVFETLLKLYLIQLKHSVKVALPEL